MLSELAGSTCRVVFDIPDGSWPFQGYPAFVFVVAVDMPMVKMKSSVSTDDCDSVWINVKFIKEISFFEKPLLES